MKLREMVAASLFWHLVAVAVLPSCATVGAPVKACTQGLTEELTATAANALAGDDYEARIAADFAGVAACLTVAAVEAAIDRARKVKFSGAGAAGVASSIQLHGDAWLSTHRRT